MIKIRLDSSVKEKNARRKHSSDLDLDIPHFYLKQFITNKNSCSPKWKHWCDMIWFGCLSWGLVKRCVQQISIYSIALMTIIVLVGHNDDFYWGHYRIQCRPVVLSSQINCFVFFNHFVAYWRGIVWKTITILDEILYSSSYRQTNEVGYG